MTAHDILDQLRKDIVANSDSLAQAKTRQKAALAAAETFEGALRTYQSGSVATRFTNHPVSDADCGVVMDRRSFPALGPDGDSDLPAQLVEDLRCCIRPTLKEIYPDVVIKVMKRGLLIEFHEPLASGEDPTVDLVLALNRVEDDALWIPNLDRNQWDASHPEKHVLLFTAGSDGLRQTRRHVVRIAKAQVKQFAVPAVCSFNLAALAWECIEFSEPIDLALRRFYDYAATEMAKRLTADPAGVSPSVKVEDRDIAVKRFRKTADNIALAIEAGDDQDKVQDALTEFGVFWKLLDPPSGSSSSAINSAIASGSTVSIDAAGRLHTGAIASTTVKSTRSYGTGHGALG